MSNKIKYLLAFIAINLLPAKAFAQPRINGAMDIFFRGIETALLLSGLVAVGYIVYAGYMWMIAAGDPQKTKAAQGTITWAIIGLVFLFILNLILIPILEFLGA